MTVLDVGTALRALSGSVGQQVTASDTLSLASSVNVAFAFHLPCSLYPMVLGLLCLLLSGSSHFSCDWYIVFQSPVTETENNCNCDWTGL